MDLDEALRHLEAGVATEEEKQFVKEHVVGKEGEITPSSPRVITSPKPPKIKGEKRETSKLLVLVLVVCAALVALAAIFGGVFGSAAASANKKDNLNRAAATEIATRFAFEASNDSFGVGGLPLITSIDDMRIEDVDRNLRYDASKPSNSYYTYDIRIVAMGVEFEVVVDSRMPVGAPYRQYCKIRDIDKN